jgi:hypothetical protein
MHQTIENCLRTLLHGQPPQNVQDILQHVDNALATAAHSARCAVHRTLKISPGALIFQRDMFLEIPVIADLELLRTQRQAAIDTRTIQNNQKRISHDYQPGEHVLVRLQNPATLDAPTEGPFLIVRAYTNGTVTIRRDEMVEERINIRRLLPFRQPAVL